jgi:drug/metabolite transporter (DMT)-like permease
MTIEPDDHQGARGSTRADRAPSRLNRNPFLLLALAALFWSGNHIVGRAISDQVPPIGISTVRWLIPAHLLWPLARLHLQRDWPLIRARWRVMLWLGVTGGALFSALQYIGLQYTSALNVSVLNSLVPILIIAAGALIFRDRVTPRQAVGITFSLTGVLVVVALGTIETLVDVSFNAGDLIIVLNMAVFAIYAACLRPRVHWLSFMFALSAISAAMTMPFFIWESMSGNTFQPTALTAFAILYVSIFPSLLAFAAWNRGVEIISAARAGPFLHLVPIFTAVFSIALLGEPLAVYQLAGFGIIVMGVWLASSGGQKLPSRTD